MTTACGIESPLRPVRPSRAALLGKLIGDGLSRAARYCRFYGAMGRVSGYRVLPDSRCHGEGKRVSENPDVWVDPAPLHARNVAVVSQAVRPQRGLTAHWPFKAPHLHPRLRQHLAALAVATLAGPAFAGIVTLSGNLGDSNNTALVASKMGAPQFSDDLATANNVALHALHVAQAGNVSFSSIGFALGGIDPYFTLFNGTDRAIATFFESNGSHAQSVGGDFTQVISLAAGNYTVAIGAYENLSLAENLGSGFLADGFIGLGDPRFFGDGSYNFSITLPDTTSVPEPSGAALVLTAACAAMWAGRCRRRWSDNV